VVGWGPVTRATGKFQGYRCHPAVGGPHRFSVPVEVGSRRRRSAGGAPACPDHPGAHTVRGGTYREKPTPTRQLYACHHRGKCSDTCQKACDGSGHDGPCRFVCLKSCQGDHDGDCFRPCRAKRATCEAEHEGWGCVRLCPSKCEREHAGPCLRACRKACDGTHTFTHDLPRLHVHTGEACEGCLELRGYHRGETAAARRHRPTARSIAQALNDLSLGESYAVVGRAVLRRAGIKVVAGVNRRRVPDPAPVVPSDTEPDGLLDLPPLDPEWPNAADTNAPEEPAFVEDAITTAAIARRRRTPSEAARLSHRVWHVGADIVEAFAPVLWEKTDRELRERADKSRAIGPETWIIDEIPVYALDDTGKRRKTDGYSIFCLAVLDWSDEERPGRARIRLIRALPKSTSVAWRLVFYEMGSRPDIIVSDAATPIRLAVSDHWRGCEPLFVPSVWHLRRALETNSLEDALKVPGESRDMLNDHLSQLARDGSALASVDGWHRWWDQLDRLAAGSGRVKPRSLAAARANYEERMAAALPVLLSDPRLVQSTGGIESQMRNALSRVLDNRKQQFANIERTNNLMDLVVVRANDGFVHQNDVARLIEADEVPHRGRTVPMRSVADPSPRGQRRYRSLRDEFAMNALAADRGIA
jgi:hypothetical protein